MLRPRRLSALLAAALLVALAGARAAAGQTFHRIPLPTTLGDASTLQFGTFAVAPDGNAAAVMVTSGEARYLYHWTVGGGGKVIGRFDAAGIARLSDDGRVVVLQSAYPHVIQRWTAEGGVQELERVEGTDGLSRTAYVTAVSNDGNRIVYSRYTQNPNEGFCTREQGPCRESSLDEVFLWSPAQGAQKLYGRTNVIFHDGTGETPVVVRDVEELVVQKVSNDGAWLFGSLRENLYTPAAKSSVVQVSPAGAIARLATRPDGEAEVRVEAASETGDVVYSLAEPNAGTRTWGTSGGAAPSVAHLPPSAQLLAASRTLGSHVYVPDPAATATWSVRVRGAAGAETRLNRSGNQCYALAGFHGDDVDGALVVLECFVAGDEAQVWTRAGGMRPLGPLLRRAAAADSALVGQQTSASVVVTGAALHPQAGTTGVDAWVVSMAAPRLVVRDVARFGKASTPLAGVEVTIRGTVTVADTTDARGTVALPDANTAGGFDPSQLADIRLRDLRTGLVRTFQSLRPSEIADTTLTLPLDLVRRLNAGTATLATSDVADLPVLRQIGDALLEYDTTGVRDLRAAWFRDLAETAAVHRQRDEHLGRLVASVDGLVTLHASEKPLANQVASVGVQAVTTLLAGQKAIQQVERQIATDASGVFASSGGAILKAIALAVTQAGNSGLHGAYLAFSGTVESALPEPWNTAWSWLGEAATKGIGDGIAGRSASEGGAAFLGTLIETVVEKTAGPLVDAVYIGQTQDDLNAAAQRARVLAGQGTPRAGFEASLTRASAAALRLDERLSASTAILATAKGWADFGDLTLVVGRVPGAQVAAVAGAIIRGVSFAGLAVDEILNVNALHTAASSDSPSLVALAYGLPPVAGAAPEPPGPTVARAAADAMQQASAVEVFPALDRYAAHLATVRAAVQTGTVDAARIATDSLLRADEDLRRALDGTHAELSALAPASDAVAAAQRRLLGRTGVLSGDGLRLYASLLPHLIPALAADPDGVSDGGPLDGPMMGIADTILVRIPRVQASLDSVRAAFDAAQALRAGVTAPPTLVVVDPGVGVPPSVAPGAFTVRVRVKNAGTSVAEGATVTLVADGDTTGGPPAVLHLTSSAAQALGTLAPGQTVEATWTLAARDTSASARGSSGLYRVETASTTAGAVARRAVQRVGVSASTGVDIEAESAVASNTGIEAVYPNPARYVAVVRYTLATPGRVVVRVYDLLGREAMRRMDAVPSAGRQEATLDVSALAQGTYAVRLVVDGRVVATKRLVVLR